MTEQYVVKFDLDHLTEKGISFLVLIHDMIGGHELKQKIIFEIISNSIYDVTNQTFLEERVACEYLRKGGFQNFHNKMLELKKQVAEAIA